MFKYFCLEFKKTISNKMFLIVALLNILFLIYVNYIMDDIFYISDNNFYMQLFFISQSTTSETNAFYFIMPMLAAIASSDILSQDKRNKSYINNISRINRNKYILAKGVVSFLVGGIAIILPFVLDFIIKLAMYPINLPPVMINARFNFVMGISDIFVYNPMLYVDIAIIATFLYAGLFSFMGFVASLFTEKLILVTAVPFIVTMIVWNITNILNVKTYPFASVLIFRVTQNVFDLKEIFLVFMIPFIIFLVISIFRGKNHEFI